MSASAVEAVAALERESELFRTLIEARMEETQDPAMIAAAGLTEVAMLMVALDRRERGRPMTSPEIFQAGMTFTNLMRKHSKVLEQEIGHHVVGQ